MAAHSASRLRWAIGIAAVAALVVAAVAWRLGVGRLPGPGSETYREVVSAFYTGVVAMDVDTKDRATAGLTRATELVPQEPAAWANRGLLAIREGDYEEAAALLERARSLAPRDARVAGLLGLLESQRGRFAEAIAHLRLAVELDPTGLKARYALLQAVERQGDPGGDEEARRQVEAMLEQQPDNLAVLLERARLAGKRGDEEALRDTVSRLGRHSASWPPLAQEQYRALEQAARENPRLAGTRVAFLRNVLAPTPRFRQDLDAIQPPTGTIGEPIDRFLRLPPPPLTFAPPDDALRFAVEPIGEPGAGPQDALLAVPLSGEGAPVVLVAGGGQVRRADDPGFSLPFPGGEAAGPPSPSGILAVTLDSDSRMDLVLAGPGGLALYRQAEGGAFADVTPASGLAPEIVGADYVGAWAADVELDGDLDLVLGPREGPPTVLRNNGDGSFEPLSPFGGASDLRAFAWADLDQDGDPDVAMLDRSGALRVDSNERAGLYTPRPAPEGVGRLSAIAVADLDGDSVTDLVAIDAGGAVVRISDRDEGRSWEVAEVARWPEPASPPDRLLVADLDNNGGLDLIASGPSGSRIWLADEGGAFGPLAAPDGLRVLAAADLSGDGLLDPAGLAADGRPARAVALGSRGYRWQVIRPRAADVVGDGRINPFGLGGEVGLRSGLLVQRQVIAGPVVHFGLGEHPKADVARIVWPNGTVQAEFDLSADQELVAQQRLKGSCPFLFASDGDAVQFVTDFLWRSPLGLRINGQDTAGVSQTEDWVKIRGDQLAATDGFYDVRITAELWETHFFDHMTLMVVDHPEGTEVFVDERFSARQPPPLVVHPTGPLLPVAAARDDAGRDVTEVIRARDGRYLDTFGRGPYQGITRDHWVEIELPADAPADRPLWIVAHGWTHPTDSSINVAISQGRHDPPKGLSLEVPGEGGAWEVAIPDLGFPAGKNKTILVPLSGVFRPGAPRRCRLRTNLEVYWDELAVAEVRPDASLKTERLAPDSAVLRPRGYSLIEQADASSPELPRYDTMVGSGQAWRDLIGFYTRFGDVRELLEAVDDRYVIANAGDELALRFPAPPAPRPGWVRDFVMIGDGWNKDGDYNTAFSKTVLPLPSHDRPAYDTPPGALEDDPVYRRNPGDWQEFHTRYVTTRDFQRGLGPRRSASPPLRSESSR